MAKSLHQSKEEFLSYYSKEFPDLDVDAYLSRKNSPVLLFSPKHEKELRLMFSKKGLSWIPLGWFPNAINRPPEVPISESLPGFKEGWLYSLNASSLKPIIALDPQPNEYVLDASAAPGGKSLAILNYTFPKAPKLIANDNSKSRFKRLKMTLNNFSDSNIDVSCSSIEDFSETHKNKFDKILLDAPCSGEKHVFNSKMFLKRWNPLITQRFSKLQEGLVLALIPLLKEGGVLVYSTCALSHAENEDLVKEVLSENKEVSLVKVERYNELDSDLDPMFVAKLRKS